MEDTDVVPELAAVPDDDAGVHVGVLADDAASTDASALAHLCLVPDARARTDDRIGRHLGGGVHAHIGTLDHSISYGGRDSSGRAAGGSSGPCGQLSRRDRYRKAAIWARVTQDFGQ